MSKYQVVKISSCLKIGASPTARTDGGTDRVTYMSKKYSQSCSHIQVWQGMATSSQRLAKGLKMKLNT